MGINGVVKSTVKMTFYFTLKDGQQIELEEDEAEQIRDFISEKLPKNNGISVNSYLQNNNNAPLSSAVTSAAPPTRKTRKPVPSGYMLLKENISQTKNGREPATYYYYKDAVGNYGFRIEGNNTNSSRPFNILGKVSEPNSTIGRFLRRIPADSYITKGTIQKKGILRNTQTLKAVLDVLEIEKYIEREPADDARMRAEYRRIKTISEPEVVGNNHGLLEAQVSSGSVKAGISP